MVPAAIGAAGSIISSGKGGKGGGASPNLEALYRKFNSVLDASMNLFTKASGAGPDGLAATDKRALEEYQKTALNQAQAELGAYDAAAAGAGSAIGQADTAKDRARTQIATGMAQDVAQKQYAQTESLTAREAALLPNPSNFAQGFSGAGAIDQMNQNQQSGILTGILDLARMIPGNNSFRESNPWQTAGSDGSFAGGVLEGTVNR